MAIGIFIFAAGLAIGSFLNVVICRYDGELLFSFRRLGGRSHCMNCRRQLRFYDLVPVLSFVFLRGRCRACGKRISLQYPVVELATGAAFLSGYLYFLPHYSFPVFHPYAAFIAAGWVLILTLLIVMAAIDFRLMLIPDEISIALAVIGLAFASIPHYAYSFIGSYAMLFPQPLSPFMSHMAGGFAGFAALGLVHIVSRGKAMGMGDVKLAGAMGLILGFPEIVFALALGFLAGGLGSAYLLIFRRSALSSGMKTMVPFGPFLMAGFLAHVFFGERLFSWYFSLL